MEIRYKNADVGAWAIFYEMKGLSGFLCSLGDVKEMAEKAIHILEDKDRLKLFKIQAFESSKKFDIQKVVSHYESLYKDAKQAYLG